MSFVLDYELPPSAYAEWAEATNPGALAAFRKGYWSWCGLAAAPSLLGLVLAVSTRTPFFMLVFAALLVAMTFQATRYKVEHQKALAAGVAAISVKSVHLIIDDAGLHETISGVQSFAPWASVLSLIQRADTVIIRLSSGSSSLIPTSAFHSGTVELSAFTEFVKTRVQASEARAA